MPGSRLLLQVMVSGRPGLPVGDQQSCRAIECARIHGYCHGAITKSKGLLQAPIVVASKHVPHRKGYTPSHAAGQKPQKRWVFDACSREGPRLDATPNGSEGGQKGCCAPCSNSLKHKVDLWAVIADRPAGVRGTGFRASLGGSGRRGWFVRHCSSGAPAPARLRR